MSALKLLTTSFFVFAMLFVTYPAALLKKLQAEIGSYLFDNGILVSGHRWSGKWLSLVRKYTELIDKIVVHESVKDEDGSKTQEIEIFYRFIGKID